MQDRGDATDVDLRRGFTATVLEGYELGDGVLPREHLWPQAPHSPPCLWA